MCAARRSARSRPSSDRERGATLVEFALIAPLFFLLVFAIIEFGFAFNDFQSIRQGVREGARQAVVRTYGSTTGSCGLVGSSATGAPLEVRKVMCKTKERIDIGNDVRTFVRYTAADGTADDKGSVKVCAQRNVDPITGFIPAIDGIPLQSKIEMRMELAIGPGISTSSSYSETPPSGESWTWC